MVVIVMVVVLKVVMLVVLMVDMAVALVVALTVVMVVGMLTVVGATLVWHVRVQGKRLELINVVVVALAAKIGVLVCECRQ